VQVGGDMPASYGYDPVANRLSWNSTSYTYDRADRIMSAGATSYTVNFVGNLTGAGGLAYETDLTGNVQAVLGHLGAVADAIQRIQVLADGGSRGGRLVEHLLQELAPCLTPFRNRRQASAEQHSLGNGTAWHELPEERLGSRLQVDGSIAVHGQEGTDPGSHRRVIRTSQAHTDDRFAGCHELFCQ
jgi:hypothetical protein